MDFKATSKKISKRFLEIPKIWDAKSVIMEMKETGYPHWKQMEWIGFYFQYLCTKYLSKIMQIPGSVYGNVEFDGFLETPWDFKSHAINTSSHQIIINDSDAISEGIKEYGCVGIILAMGEVKYNDENRTFQQWHNILKGGMSKYEKERIKRGAWSRLRKVSFNLQQISFIQLTDETLIKSGSFQSDFRNSNGKARRSKVLLDLEKLDEEIVNFMEF